MDGKKDAILSKDEKKKKKEKGTKANGKVDKLRISRQRRKEKATLINLDY